MMKIMYNQINNLRIYMIFIYGLVCPISGEIRYIGKSIRPKERLQNHMNEISNCHRSHWLQSLKAKKLKPQLVILEEVSDGTEWQIVEKNWIEKGKLLGWDLTNNTIGGDGVLGLPPESKARMIKTWLGRKHKPETLLKISAASKRRKQSEESKQKRREKMIGREITWSDKLSIALRKISNDQEAEIRNRLANGETGIELSKEFGVHRTTISKIKMGTYQPKRKIN